MPAGILVEIGPNVNIISKNSSNRIIRENISINDLLELISFLVRYIVSQKCRNLKCGGVPQYYNSRCRFNLANPKLEVPLLSFYVINFLLIHAYKPP